MLIPTELRHFSDATLILIGDHRETRFYLTDNIEISNPFSVEAPLPAHPNQEGSVVVGKGRRANPDSSVDEGVERERYSKELVRAILETVRTNNIQSICLALPAELIRRIQEELPPASRSLIQKTLSKNLVKEDLPDVLRRLCETPASTR